MNKKTAAGGGGMAAVLVALAAMWGQTHGHTTAVSRNDTPIVINRPTNAAHSPLPVVITQAPNGVPLVIVGHGAPGQCHADHNQPDPACTPGVTDPRVTQDNISQTVCTSGYTATVRHTSQATKDAVLAEYGLSRPFAGEIDHLIPLELGGADVEANLWPEAGPIPNPKDRVEDQLHHELCTGQITLSQAQQQVRTAAPRADRSRPLLALPPQLLRIRWCESRNDYTAHNPRSSASGAYQMLRSTWQHESHLPGQESDYPRYVQDRVALRIYLQQGGTPWAASRSCWSR